MEPSDEKSHQNEHNLPQNQPQSENENSNPSDNKANEGPWTLEENKKYSFFMTYFKSIFISKERRKSIKIFKSLSEYLGTRSPRQCRSHYQKLMAKFGTMSKLKKHFRKETGAEKYDEEYRDFAITMDSTSREKKQKKVEEGSAQKQFVEFGVQTEGIFPFMMNQNASNPEDGQRQSFFSFFPYFQQNQQKREEQR